MYKTISEAEELVKGIHEAAGELQDAEIVVIPPFTALSKTAEWLAGSRIQTGAQNFHWEEEGAFTGEISPLMLKDVGCQYVLAVGRKRVSTHRNSLRAHLGDRYRVDGYPQAGPGSARVYPG